MTTETTPSDPIAAHMGHRLTRRREDLDLSRRRLASLLGCTTETLRAMETGAVRIDTKTLYDLSNLLGVSMSHFMEGLETPRRSRRLEVRLRALQTRMLVQAVETLTTEERRVHAFRLLKELWRGTFLFSSSPRRRG